MCKSRIFVTVCQLDKLEHTSVHVASWELVIRHLADRLGEIHKDRSISYRCHGPRFAQNINLPLEPSICPAHLCFSCICSSCKCERTYAPGAWRRWTCDVRNFCTMLNPGHSNNIRNNSTKPGPNSPLPKGNEYITDVSEISPSDDQQHLLGQKEKNPN